MEHIIANIVSPAVTSIIELIRNIILILTMLAGSLISYVGLKEWRKKLTGEDNYRVAKQLISVLRKYRKHFNEIRKTAIYNIVDARLANPMMPVEKYKRNLSYLGKNQISFG